jgi:MinD superfamily P-loop ATPase
VISDRVPVTMLIPRVDERICDRCARCGDICRFNAIVCLEREVLVFPKLCRACGGCRLVCPVDAIVESPRVVGRVEAGTAGAILFVRGMLDIGEVAAPEVIRSVRAAGPAAGWTITDAPPGTSCPVIESLRGNDYVVLVTEPTPFGLHDLGLAVELARALGLRFGVVINRVGTGDGGVYAFCRAESIHVLGEIPDDRRIAEAYSRGELVADTSPALAATFEAILDAVTREAAALVRS